MSLLPSLASKKKLSVLDLDLEQFGYSSEATSSISSNKIVSYTTLSDGFNKYQSFSAVVDNVISTFILIFIYFCIALEELEWLLSSDDKKDSVKIIDDSGWNIYKVLPRLLNRKSNGV